MPGTFLSIGTNINDIYFDNLVLDNLLQSDSTSNTLIQNDSSSDILQNDSRIELNTISEMCLKELSMLPCLEQKELIELESICQLLKLFEIAILVLSKNRSNSISDALTVNKYSEFAAEQYIESIRQNIIKYGARYINTDIQSFLIEVVKIN
ncbi:5954_t:CDS:2 [Cetraspora pellucida]|uniref:5954_t:CDS:1 n=1 Tax=Cetraspora pellucida TaxID=1433469 RepID=A0A9N9DTI1_9GLOM|nr:5954_t:CDS:2 [Cetraspora pellucida]